ncbi:hypothetical protein CKAN_02274100 [Cinnamomum micranthum f. kanehirae]|uniref:Uncharacterized protein n=1 Tax=Cinnamomum micranthum f. kanehirae TaxID=337451 RepID=A0A3S3NSJ8_9MAGN|nr:hypothetical protein CKAN_02274100 [Cinnamomum micranthum f. kanehirae]
MHASPGIWHLYAFLLQRLRDRNISSVSSSSYSSPLSPPIVLDASESAPPQILSIFSSPPSAPPRPRSSPPQIFSNGCRKGKSFERRRPSSNPVFKDPPCRPTILSPNERRRPSSPTAPPGLDPLTAAVPILVSWHMAIRDVHPRRCHNPLAATIPISRSNRIFEGEEAYRQRRSEGGGKSDSSKTSKDFPLFRRIRDVFPFSLKIKIFLCTGGERGEEEEEEEKDEMLQSLNRRRRNAQRSRISSAAGFGLSSSLIQALEICISSGVMNIRKKLINIRGNVPTGNCIGKCSDFEDCNQQCINHGNNNGQCQANDCSCIQ